MSAIRLGARWRGDACEGGGPGEIAAVPVTCPADAMENDIRKWGVIAMGEWFGYHASSEFTEDTIALLRERSAAANGATHE